MSAFEIIEKMRDCTDKREVTKLRQSLVSLLRRDSATVENQIRLTFSSIVTSTLRNHMPNEDVMAVTAVRTYIHDGKPRLAVLVTFLPHHAHQSETLERDLLESLVDLASRLKIRGLVDDICVNSSQWTSA